MEAELERACLQPGETRTASDLAARHGGRVAFMHRVGDDLLRQAIFDRLDHEEGTPRRPASRWLWGVSARRSCQPLTL